MVGYIYKTTNKVNGKIYIGKCKSTYFKKSYYGSGKLLWEDINKYGLSEFRVKMIHKCSTLTELNEREKYYIKYYRDKYGRENCYNIANGGNGGWGHSSSESKLELLKLHILRVLLSLLVTVVLILILFGGVYLWIN